MKMTKEKSDTIYSKSYHSCYIGHLLRHLKVCFHHQLHFKMNKLKKERGIA